MTRLLLTISIVFTFTLSVLGQEPLTYSEVVHIENVSQKELYNRAKLWFATVYNSSNDVLQIENSEEGEIIGKAVMEYNPNVFIKSEQTKGNIKYTIKIFVKDGRYKYEITDFIHDPHGNSYGKSSMGLISTEEEFPNPKPMEKRWSNKVWNDIKTQIEGNMSLLVVSLNDGMNKESESKKDDW